MTHTEPANPQRPGDHLIWDDIRRAALMPDGQVQVHWDGMCRSGTPANQALYDYEAALAALAAARSDTDQLRTENERLEAVLESGGVEWARMAGEHDRMIGDLDAARVEVDTLRAKIERVIAAARGWKTCGEHTGIASNRCMLPPNHRDRHDCQIVPGDATYLDELLAGAVPGSPPEPEKAEPEGRGDGMSDRAKLEAVEKAWRSHWTDTQGDLVGNWHTGCSGCLSFNEALRAQRGRRR